MFSAWHAICSSCRASNMRHFYLASPPEPYYATIRQILDSYAGNLAAQIGHEAKAAGSVRGPPVANQAHP
jgi:hypothetical protein